MATTSIIVNSTNSGKVLQKTITNVNPNADNDKLATWGQMLTALTDNTYTKTDRVDKANCDTESDKQTPTLQLRAGTGTTPLTEVTITSKSTTGATGKRIYYDGDGEVYYRMYSASGEDGWLFLSTKKATPEESIIEAYLMTSTNAPDGTYYIELYSTETENYKAATWKVTVTLATS